MNNQFAYFFCCKKSQELIITVYKSDDFLEGVELCKASFNICRTEMNH